MVRVFDAAPKLDAKPLVLDASLGVVEGSRQAVAAAAASGARIFDIGRDPRLVEVGRPLNAPYSAEQRQLVKMGYRPVHAGLVMVMGELAQVQEWKKTK